MAKSFGERIVGAAMLDVATYEEVEADVTATPQAAGVVALVAAAGAIGGMHGGGHGMIGGIVTAFIGWAVWSGVTYLVGTKLFDGTADWGEMLRTLGFAQAPGLLGVLAFLPLLGRLVAVVVGIWSLVACIVAIRQALDISTGKAIATAVVAVIAMACVGMLLAILGIGAGFAAFSIVH
ncbi:MAG TPA: YIP1 family protein [Longimicrobiaceae bacterium]|jgi:hypothetical protein|nr:YIP1 family protein [Longimicrobiaceae bacterium]